MTDDSGRFHFPAQDKDFQLVITHPSGFALIKSTPEWTARIIRLEPWSRVEGTFRIGKAPAANIPIEIDVRRLDSYGPDVPNIFTQHQATTGPDGRFVFERVIPGNGRIGRRITFMVDEGATEVASAYMIGADFPSGKTVHIDLGGIGRPVVGRLQPPEGFTGKVRWNFADITVVGGANEPVLHGHRGPRGQVPHRRRARGRLFAERPVHEGRRRITCRIIASACRRSRAMPRRGRLTWER